MTEAYQPPSGDWMVTFTGKEFFPYDVRPEQICIEDIAHALANMCRYGGHCKDFYSVAEHSCHVAWLLEPHGRKTQLVGLMHDATEAYLVDMPRPIKRGFAQYREMEDKLWKVIAAKFGLPEQLPHCVHDADACMLLSERDQLLPPGRPWTMITTTFERRPMVVGWSPRFAEKMFLDLYAELTK